MYKQLMSGTILSLLSVLSFNCASFAETADTSSPSEVGTTTMTPGQYSLIEETSGKKYSLMVTKKGSMILVDAPAAAAPAAAKASGLQSMAESQIKSNVTKFVEKQGMSQVKGLIK